MTLTALQTGRVYRLERPPRWRGLFVRLRRFWHHRTR